MSEPVPRLAPVSPESEPDGQWRTAPLTVGVPRAAPALYRLLRSEEAGAEAFLPDHETRQRLWTEDWCSYRGFSAWESLALAREHGSDLNRHRVERGDPPLFTHVAAFRPWPKKRHAIAWLPPLAGHFAVWAGPDELTSRVDEILPIEE